MTNRRGFTLIEVLVTLAVMVVLAAVVTPALIASIDRARLQRASAVLDEVSTAIDEFAAVVISPQGGGTIHWPPNMTHLEQALTAGQSDLCGTNYAAQARAAWKGPYVGQITALTGRSVGIGTMQHAFGYQAPVGADGPLLLISVTGVDLGDAERLDTLIDGDGSATTGTIRWAGPDASGLYTLAYVKPTRQC